MNDAGDSLVRGGGEMDVADLRKILEVEVVPAVGCTEPVAIALTAAAAMHAAGGVLRRMEIVTGVGVFKNARAVGIPGTDGVGIELAAALGAAIARPEAGMELLALVTPDVVQTANDILREAEVRSEVDLDRAGVYIRCWVETSEAQAAAETIDRHNNVRVVSVNGAELPAAGCAGGGRRPALRPMGSFRQMVDAIWGAPADSFTFMIDRTLKNLELAEYGLATGTGMGIGKCPDLPQGTTASLTAAACDARMSGVQRPVCTCAGSGNQGISATVPVLSEARTRGASDEVTGRCLALSCLVTLYIKEYLGLLSPVCGCAVAAGAGSAAGLVMLGGGGPDACEDAASTVLATLAGMLCDGGKVGCAMKVWAAVSTAEEAARLALAGCRIPAGNGVVKTGIDETLRVLERVAREGMGSLDRALVAAMCG